MRDGSGERWLPLPGFEGCEVSDHGRIRRGDKLMRLTPSDSGYLRARIKRDGRTCSVLVHRAVLLAFVGKPPTRRHHAAHFPDRDRGNNRLANLCWKKPKDNEADKKLHGTVPAMRVRVVPEAALAVYMMRALRYSYSCIARTTGLHRSSVSRIDRGLRWSGAT